MAMMKNKINNRMCVLLFALMIVMIMWATNIYAEGTPVIEIIPDKDAVSSDDTITLTIFLRNVQAFSSLSMKVKATGMTLQDGNIGDTVAAATGATVAEFNGESLFISGINVKEAKDIKDLVLGKAEYKVDQDAEKVKVELSDLYCESAGREITQTIEYPKDGISLKDDTLIAPKVKHNDTNGDGLCDDCGADLTKIGKNEKSQSDNKVMSYVEQNSITIAVVIVIAVLCSLGIFLLRKKASK